MNEIWVIDHSTTTAEAATHTGGTFGKGGDFLYRWGNPQAYGNGVPADQKIWGQHDASWIEAGLPNAGQIMIFVNSHGLATGNYSSVDRISPPVDGTGVYASTLPYGPATNNWSYQDATPANFYASNISSAQQLANGNVLIANGPAGTMFEVDSTKQMLWKYINPANTAGLITQGNPATQNLIFRCSFYPSNYAGFTGHTLTPGQPIELNPLASTCTLATKSQSEIVNEFSIYPNPANTHLYINTGSRLKESVDISIVNTLGEVVFQKNNVDPIHQNNLDVSSLENGVYFLQVNTVSINYRQKIIVAK